jgi:alpha-L-fucosidase 2
MGKSNDVTVEKIQKAQLRLYPTKIARDDSIMEWVSENYVVVYYIF